MNGRFIQALACCLLCSGCYIFDDPRGDPAAPTADGVVMLGSAVDAGSFETVELRMCPIDAGVSPACAPTHLTASIRPDGGFPVSFSLPRGLGLSQNRDWKVIAWLNRGDAGVAPVTGEWWGQMTFFIANCGCSTCYCGGASTTVTIDRVAP